MTTWAVYKFGGTSLADADCFGRVADIVEAHRGSLAVVVSACRGVTDQLMDALERAAAQDLDYLSIVAQLRERHEGLASALLDPRAAADYATAFAEELQDLKDLLHATRLLRNVVSESRHLVSGLGELWSARLLSALLRARGTRAAFVDAREVLVVRDAELGVSVDWERSASQLAARQPGPDTVLVITGYIAADERGVATTLGRNGSDFSASIFGALLAAAEIHIWTDVDGIMSADPRLVPDVHVMEALSYNEAMELAYFGAKVIHPRTMAPAVAQQIPIFIRNTFAPQLAGTRISASSDNDKLIKGITTIHDIALVNLEGAGMIGVPGTAHRVFGALREAGISVVLISQASSEHSICFAVPEPHLQRVSELLADAFSRELAQGLIQQIGVSPGCSILAVVGDAMGGTPGVAGKLFNTLGNAGINVRAIAQGSSERNISAVIDRHDAPRAVRAVHAGFYLSPQTVSIGVIGPGNVGGALLRQLAGERERLLREFHLDLRVRALASSSRMLLDPREVRLASWREDWDGCDTPLELDAFVAHTLAEHLPHAVIIDCSASQQVADRYAEWLAAGIHVVTPNKKANTAAWEYFQSLHRSRRASRTHYMYETTVGAGLPIIQTLRDLRQTGDRILRIEGILSGTLAYLFNRYDGRLAFSDLVRDARADGLTEPDPRDDLSGMDVARKLVILGREMGLALELGDVEVQSLVPERLAALSIDDFLDGMQREDERMRELWREADAADSVLRYAAELDVTAPSARVSLSRFSRTHPFAHMNATDNMVRFITARYHENPLVVQGPGAGPEVTAAGVFADLLRLCAYLGATL